MGTVCRVLAVASIGALALVACGDESADGQPVSIIAIGDSNTDRAGAATYRCYLDQMLTEAGVSFDYVGGETPTSAILYDCPTEFDMYHEAAFGGRINEIADPAVASVEALQPDVALVLLGGNDLRFQTRDDAPNELVSFVEDLQAASPDLTILVGQLLPCVPNVPGSLLTEERCEDFTPAFNEAIASFGELSTATSTVTVVDMHTGFRVDDLLSDDGVHPTDAGDEEMARRWMAALAESGAVES